MKDKKIYVLVGFVIAVICFGFIAFFLNTSKKEVSEDSNSSFTDVSLSDTAVLELYRNINVRDSLLFNYTLLKDSSIANTYILGAAMARCKNDGLEVPLKSNDLALCVRKVFGDVSFINEDFVWNKQQYIYDNQTEEYIINSAYDYAQDDEKILRKLVSAKKSTTEYILTEKIVVVTSDVPNRIYNDVNYTKLLGEDENPDIENYLNEASTYNYHFTFNGETFVLTSVTK